MSTFFRVILIIIGTMLGIIITLIIGANSDWATIRIPLSFFMASKKDLLYEARVWAVILISFSVGATSLLPIYLYYIIKFKYQIKTLKKAVNSLKEELDSLKVKKVSENIEEPGKQ